jgi:hypothetical protein
MRPVHRAKQVADYHESEFQRQIPTLLKHNVIRIADKQFDYDGRSVHTRLVLPNGELAHHMSFWLHAAITQVGHLHKSYRTLSMTCGPFGAAHTHIDVEVRMQNHKAAVLDTLAGFLVCLGWDIVPFAHDRRTSDDEAPADVLRHRSWPHTTHLFDLKTQRRRLAMHACESATSGARRIGAFLVDTSKYHVHVNLMWCQSNV